MMATSESKLRGYVTWQRNACKGIIVNSNEFAWSFQAQVTSVTFQSHVAVSLVQEGSCIDCSHAEIFMK